MKKPLLMFINKQSIKGYKLLFIFFILSFNMAFAQSEEMLEYRRQTLLENKTKSIINQQTNSALVPDEPIQVNPGGTNEFLIQEQLIGDLCIEPTNLSINPQNADFYGTFSSGLSSIGIDEGVILATGNISVANGPNVSGNSGTGGPTAGFDSDLADLIGNTNLNNVTILEFDLVPDEDMIAFDYVFASEEYCDFVNTGFNDVFGFFLSGPGINGPFTDNAINIATIPGTTTPVAINNVNYGLNSQYYVSNASTDTGGGCTAAELNEPHPYTNLIEYDGFTTVLTAEAEVVPCETYHIKIAIADVGDGAWDSAVFLGKNSFVSGEVNSSINVTAGYKDPLDSAADEGCENAYIVFEKTPPDQSLTVNFSIDPSSTATEGVDFATLPTSITIPAGVQYDTLWIDIFGDLLVEGVETIDITVIGVCDCFDPMVQVQIIDPLPKETTVRICEGEIYNGPNGPISSPTNFSELFTGTNGCDSILLTYVEFDPITYYDTLIYACFNEVVEFEGLIFNAPGEQTIDFPNANSNGCDSVVVAEVEWLNPEYPIAQPNTLSCYLESVQLQTLNTDYTNLSFEWTGPDGFFSDELTPLVSAPGLYELVITETIGNVSCQSVSNLNIFVTQDTVSPVIQELPNVELYCGQTSDIIAPVIENINDIPSISYLWIDPNNTVIQSQFIFAVEEGTYTLIVTNTANGCAKEISFESIFLDAEPEITIEETGIGCGSNSAVIQSSVDIEGGTYQWTGPNGFTSNEESPTVMDTGTYQLTYFISDVCQSTETTFLGLDNSIPEIELIGDTLDCINTSANLTAIVDNPISTSWVTPDDITINQTNIDVSEPGTYFFSSTGTNGCIAEDSIELLLFEEFPEFELSGDTLTCAKTEINLNILTDETLDFSTLTPENDILNGQDPIINSPGEYQVTGINEFGCQTIDTITIMQDTISPVLTLNVPPITCENPEVEINYSNSNQEFTQEWTGPNGFSDNSDSIKVNSPGSYQVELTSENGCENIYSFDVQIDTLYPQINIDNDTLKCNLDFVTLSADGVLPQYTIQWFNAVNNEFIGDSTNIQIDQNGDFYALVENTSNGCVTQQSASVINDINFPVVNVTADTITCSVTDILLDLENIDSDLTYNWSGPNGYTSTDAEPLVSEPGVYQLVAINDLGCETFITQEVLENTVSPEIQTFDDEITCLNPTITPQLFINGNNYSIAWEGPNNFTSNEEKPELIEPGEYLVSVTNSNGCSNSEIITITIDTITPDINLTVSDTLNCNNTSAIITCNSDYPNLDESTLAWAGLAGFILIDDFTIQASQPGIYDYLIQGPSGCSSVASIELIADYDTVQIQTVDGLINCADPTYIPENSFTEKEIEFISWTGPSNFNSSEENPIFDQAGTYQVEVTANNGCSSFAELIVNSNFNAPDIEIIGDTLSCENEEIEIIGFTSINSPIYTWTDPNDNSITSSTISTSNPGTFELNIKDNENGCDTTESIDIIELPELFEFNWIIADPNCNREFGEIEFTNFSGGTPPVRYSIDGGNTYTSDSFFENVIPGTYDIHIIDSKTCELSASTTIDTFTESKISGQDLYIKFLGESATFEIETELFPSEIESISWFPSENLSCSDCLSPEIIALADQFYNVEIIDTFGCVYNAEIEIRVVDRPIYVPNVFTPNNLEENEFFTFFGDFSSIEVVNKFSIYDRWGNFVYHVENKEPDDPLLRWYGNFNEKPAQQGVYVYIIEYVTLDNRTVVLQGDVTLLR